MNVDIDSFSILEKEIVMYLGQDKTLALGVSPNVAVPFTYVSDNPRIVAALNTGRLQAVKLGEVTITVSYFGHEETCTVRVVTKEEYLAMGYEMSQEDNGAGVGCNASLSGVCGGLLLMSALLSGLYIAKRKED